MRRCLAAKLTLLIAAAVHAGEPPKTDRFGDALPEGAILRLGTTRLRHARLCSLAFTADGRLVSFGGDYVARTWDVKTGKQLAERSVEKDELWRDTAGCL